MKTVKIPEDIKKILEDEGIWEDDSLDPILVRVMESEYKGKDVITHELEFAAWEDLGKINEFLEQKGIDLDGYDWENIIIEISKIKNPKLTSKIHADSEGETCVLWTETKEDFYDLLKIIYELIDTPENFKHLIKK